MSATFTLLDIDALACGLDNRQAWQAWALLPAWPQGAALPATPSIAPMAARRMSPAIRMAVELALTMIARWQPDRLVCVSRHGELQRTFSLLQKVVAREPLSPTDFSLSVHNTVAGLATITAARALPATSIAAGAESFHAGLIEASATLQCEGGRVLLLAFEGALPPFYADLVSVPEPAHAVAMVLAPGADWRYQGVVTPAASDEPPMAGALAFWRGELLGTTQRLLPGGAHTGRLWSCGAL